MWYPDLVVQGYFGDVTFDLKVDEDSPKSDTEQTGDLQYCILWTQRTSSYSISSNWTIPLEATKHLGFNTPGTNCSPAMGLNISSQML